MKKYLKAIGCFPIFVLAVFLYFREQSYKLDSLSLQNVEALAEGEEYTHISCIASNPQLSSSASFLRLNVLSSLN